MLARLTMATVALTMAAAGLATAAAAQTGAMAASTAAPLPVIADITAKPEDAAVIRSAMERAAAGARSEPGCLSYILYEDRQHPGHFMTYETWTNDAALDAHLSSPAMRAGFAKLGPMLVQPPVVTRLKALPPPAAQ